MNRKGQALVEFVLILPVFILILFTVVDFGNILYSKISMENDSTDIVMMLKNGNDISDIKTSYDDLDIVVSNYKDNYLKVDIRKKIRLFNPLLHKVLGNPCVVDVERIVLDE